MAAVCFRLIKVILGATQTSSVLCNKTKINKCIFTKYKLQINMLRTATLDEKRLTFCRNLLRFAPFLRFVENSHVLLFEMLRFVDISDKT